MRADPPPIFAGPKLDLVGRMHGAGWYARTTDLEELPRIRLQDWQRRT